jgi:medium-chain acyl-[acyl-carrier-protein] hydrolase
MSAWIKAPRPNPRAKVRLFCFPYSGASASMYYSWVDILPASVEVYPVQLPGHGNRVSEIPYTSLPPLIDAVESALLPYLDKPFAFFGHSMGALVSFELARRLEKKHALLPVYLFVSGHNAPQIPDETEHIHALPEHELLDKLRMLNGTPEEVFQDPELRDLLIPVLRADFTVCETYNFKADQLLDCPICACGGLGDKYIDRYGLQAWSELTTGTFSLRLFPGDHFYLNNERMYLLQAIAQEINSVIDLRV